jgi:hypothetical protein
MKHVISTAFCYIYPEHNWHKPLNPILGETYQCYLSDGSFTYLEQISHHPPISYLHIEGPNSMYRFYGYSTFAVKARLNHVSLEVGGHKIASFPDGTEIKFNNTQDHFQNTMLGTCHHMLVGDFVFTDEKNGLRGTVNIGDVPRRPRDYLAGKIEQ